MCPPASVPVAAEIGENWTDEGIFTSLSNFKNGSPLPSNVTSDVNPYHYRPSDLPADLWYFCSCVKKDAKCGFWVETGDACEVVSNSTILGSRTTLQFYEGQAPYGRKTDWVMQEYRITEKFKDNLKDHRALCRVFLADDNRPFTGHSIANIDGKICINLDPKTVSHVNTREQISTSELLENKTGMSSRRSQDFLENSSEMDCLLRGDYFELNDLIDPGYHSSSSANSSCLTMTSDEYFDSIALLQELEDDIKDQEMKDSSLKFYLSTTVKSKGVVIVPPTSVSVGNAEECKAFDQKASKVDERIGSTSNGVNATASSSDPEGTSKEGKKEDVGRTKKRKMMKYLCFMAF
ncbi:NAC domain-containing protein 83-like [Cynara cardunculus var. scolymus]|uniref:NAC domain-containing protein 83-like n=1 Tax=Cynara cardunculus var. scolymus TaxID=59895 RepID=UPI000D62D04D|nr:NAC domain-containing protein 83-like [Cynara cardunculus var. scolymus]